MPNTATPRPNHPTLNLSGTWAFALDAADGGIREEWFRRSLSESIQLPGSVDAQGLGHPVTLESPWTGTIFNRDYYDKDAYAPYREPGNIKVPFFLQPETHYIGVAWYQKSIKVNDAWTGKRIRLMLERPHWETQVWIDEHEIGKGDSLSTPHEWNLGQLEAGRSYRLTIRVDNRQHIGVGQNAHSISDHTQGNWNGIVGRMELQAIEDCRIAQLDVIPDASSLSIRVRGILQGQGGERTLKLKVYPKDGSTDKPLVQQSLPLTASGEITPFELELELGPEARLWDEFDPFLYELQADCGSDQRTTPFGLRSVSVDGSQIAINGRKVYFRGTLDCCIFPLTGHPPMDVDSWRKILRQIQSHGLNHVRFHSWCPPEAAFDAADELGVYFQVECPTWPNVDAVLASDSPAGIGDGDPIDRWVYEESERILQAYGNHPCFVLMASGNEPGGPNHCEYLSQWLLHFRKRDPRRLYCSGAGWPELAESDFHIPSAPRLYQWGDGLKSRINALPPAASHDYSDIIAERDAPVISHEIGQWCAYPPIYDTDKYSGHLKARSYEIYADSLQANHMGDQIRDFVRASGKLQALCYKEEIEASLRSKGQAGFQLLGLQDFPGQQTAPVGIVDAFWDNKGYLEATEMSRFCNATVPLIRLEKRVFASNETLSAALEIAHYGPEDLNEATIHWELTTPQDGVVKEGRLAAPKLLTGNLQACGSIEIDWAELPAPAQYNLSVELEGAADAIRNDWELWLYPAKLTDEATEAPAIVRSVTEALALLEEGKSVLCIPEAGQIEHRVELGFSSIFWNTACTQGQPPHTLGILCDPVHPALEHFPTDAHSNWQWWYPIQAAEAMVLDELPPECRPVVQVIDDWFKNRRLGLILEARVGKGKLLLCSIDLLAKSDTPEQNLVCRQLLHSLKKYVQGPKFDPQIELRAEELESI
ncbi:MAG: hypothetical protein JJU20_09805 [Opitutales bacterium]|nr:hypothetical protein [Opitutales bacterium]